MSQLRTDVGLITLATCLAAFATYRTSARLAVAAIPTPTIGRTLAVPQRESADSLEAMAQGIVDSDPFRVSNQPSDIAFDPTGDALGNRTTPSPAPAVPPRPTLVLKAIMGGPPWQAVIDGIPGQGQAVVGPGSTYDKISVRSVTRDSVVVQGADTTWVLRLGRGR